jgi:hypothetical protein
MTEENVDMNRDPISNTPGSHPVGTAVGATGGAVAGALAGGLFGPIGMLVGGGIGAVAGGGAGHAVAEEVNPTGEIEYWRTEHKNRKYYDSGQDFERDYLPAYRHGWEARSAYGERDWDEDLESELASDWEDMRAESGLDWEDAQYAVRDSWDRTDQTYRAYSNTDRYFSNRCMQADYYDSGYTFDDYRPAYRYGTYARTRYPERDWDDRLENQLGAKWDEFKGDSRLAWNKAKDATRDAWHSIERVLPGDFDNDGR